MNRILLLVVLAVGAVAAWYAITPRATVEDLRAAALAHDTETIDAIVDFDSVRAHLRSDLREYLARDSDSGEESLGRMLGRTIGSIIGDGLIDTFVSPMGLAVVLSGRLPDQDPPSEAAMERTRDYSIDRQGFNRFAVRFDADENDGTRPLLEFRRDGIHWRMVRIRLEN